MTDIILLGVGILIFGILFYMTLGVKAKDDSEEGRKLQKSLEDEFIYDPETGARITLEQATSGQWIAHDNAERIKTEEELQQFYTEQEAIAEGIANHMKLSGYKSAILSDSQVGTLAETQTLGKYDDWSYTHSFSFNDGRDYVLFPTVEWKGKRYLEDYFRGSQLLFWIQIENTEGHYYFREKSGVEELLDIFRKDDELQLGGYECFTLNKSTNIIYINRLLNRLKNQKSLEIEIIGPHLFVKSTQFICKQDFFRIEKVFGIGS